MAVGAVKRRSTERVRVIQDTGDTDTTKAETFQSGDRQRPEGELTVQQWSEVVQMIMMMGYAGEGRIGRRFKERF